MATSIIPSTAQEIIPPIADLLNTDWHFEYLECHDLRLSSREVVEAAYNEAPTAEAKAYIFAILEMRDAIAAASGRTF